MNPQRTFGRRGASCERGAHAPADAIPNRQPASFVPIRRRRKRATYLTGCPPPGLEVFRSHLDALYLLALLYTGDVQLAEEAIVDAVVSASSEPSITDADPTWVWSVLASRFRVPNEQTVVQGSIATTIRMAGLSAGQRETMALIMTGRTPDDVALLLKVSAAQVQDDFCVGAWALNTAMGAAPT
jgi:hypothetical protein